MPKLLRRTLQLRLADPDDDDDADVMADDGEDCFPLTLSSDSPVPRFDERSGIQYDEVLSHEPGAISFQRVPLPFTEGHDAARTPIGVVDSLRVARGRLRGVAHFGKSRRAREVAGDIRGGVVRDVSVGYSIDQADWDEDGTTLRAIRWTPMEVSSVSVGADRNAGFFRSVSMSDEPNGGGLSRSQRRAARAAAANEITAAETERGRAADIAALAQRHGMAHRVSDWLANGLTRGQIHEEILVTRATQPMRMPSAEQLERAEREGLRASPSPAALIPPEELRRYSLLRAIRSQVMSDSRVAIREAGHELEISRVLSDHCGRAAKGIMVPDEVIFGPRSLTHHGFARAMTVGTASAGGDLVATNLLAGELIETLNTQPQVVALGARRLSGLVGNAAIPRLTSGSAVTWIGEGGDYGDTTPAFDQPTMTPHDLAARVDITRRLLIQSTPAADALVRGDWRCASASALTLQPSPVRALQTNRLACSPCPAWDSCHSARRAQRQHGTRLRR